LFEGETEQGGYLGANVAIAKSLCA
jgi:hypothetical protein